MTTTTHRRITRYTDEYSVECFEHGIRDYIDLHTKAGARMREDAGRIHMSEVDSNVYPAFSTSRHEIAPDYFTNNFEVDRVSDNKVIFRGEDIFGNRTTITVHTYFEVDDLREL